MSTTLAFCMGAFLGFAIGAVSMLDIFLLMAYHDLRKGKKK